MLNDKMLLIMFSNISWSSYMTAVSLALLCWYLIILVRFYREDLKKILSGEKKFKFPNLNKSSKKGHTVKSISELFPKSFDTLEEAEELSIKIRNVFAEIAEKNLPKEQLENYLRMVLEEYPYVKISSLKENINALMVSESIKHSEFTLTLSEADSLWEGAVF